MQTQEDTEDARPLAITQDEAERLLDSFPVTNPCTSALALKVAALLREWAAEPAMRRAALLLSESAR